MCVTIMHMHAHACACGDKSHPLKLELHAVVILSIWVMGTQLRSSAIEVMCF